MTTEDEIVELMYEVADFIPHQEELNKFYLAELAKLHKYHEDLQKTVMGLAVLVIALFGIVIVLMFKVT